VKGIDTNILVRYLVRDDPVQFRAASRLIENDCSLQEPGFVNQVVLVEIVWVLESGYRLARPEIVRALRALLLTSQLSIEHPDDARAALDEYEDGADFADSLIAAANSRAGCEYTATLDRTAARRKGFHLIK
jgi:predicted nucleic-acid-binding protein